jgi:hypothetical protein
MRRRPRRRKFPAENVAPPALVFRFASPFDAVDVELRVVNGKQLIVMDNRFGVGGHDSPVMVEIKKPDGASDQQENDEDGELFLLLHAPVLK